MRDKSASSLFDDIFEQSGLQYISDMSLPENMGPVYNAILHMDAAAYPKSQWRDLSVYITGGADAFSSAAEALEYFHSKQTT